MAAHLTEEEQIEAVKRWWKENGKMIIGVLFVVVAAWFGWTTWKDNQAQVAEEIAGKYAELVAAVNVEDGETLSDEQQSTAELIAGEIIDLQPKSLYGNFASLILADLAVADDELDQAAAELRKTLDNAANDSIAKLANLRLARVLSAQGDNDSALATLEGDVPEAFQAAYAETRGDIYLAQEELELAQTAYQEALANLTPQQANRNGLVQLKLDNTRVAEGGSRKAEQPISDESQQPAVEGEG